MGNCDLHLDAPLAKWTLDVCVDQSHVWPIHFSQVVPWPEFAPERALVRKSDSGLQFTAAALHPGDAVLFSGSSQWHYRDALRDAVQQTAGANPAGRTFCDLLFFHFIPKGTLRLINPNEWADLFGIAELALTTPFDMGK
jgi:hypothetical protein